MKLGLNKEFIKEHYIRDYKFKDYLLKRNYKTEIKKIIDFHFPRFSELPKVPLYKDQVIIYIESKLMDIKIYEDENLLTPTMLNNYVKQKVIAAPIDKKYDEQQLAY